MPRVKLQERKVYPYRCEIQVRITDINNAGHAGYDLLVQLMHEAIFRFYKHLGVSEGNLGDNETGVVVADLAVNYLGEAFAGDILTIDASIADITEKSFRFYLRLKRNGVPVLLGETGVVAYSYIHRKVSKIPEEFLKKITNLEEIVS